MQLSAKSNDFVSLSPHTELIINLDKVSLDVIIGKSCSVSEKDETAGVLASNSEGHAQSKRSFAVTKASSKLLFFPKSDDLIGQLTFVSHPIII